MSGKVNECCNFHVFVDSVREHQQKHFCRSTKKLLSHTLSGFWLLGSEGHAGGG